MASKRELEDDSEDDFNPGNAEHDEEDEDYNDNAAKQKQKRKSAFVDDAAEDDDEAVSWPPTSPFQRWGQESDSSEQHVHRY